MPFNVQNRGAIRVVRALVMRKGWYGRGAMAIGRFLQLRREKQDFRVSRLRSVSRLPARKRRTLRAESLRRHRNTTQKPGSRRAFVHCGTAPENQAALSALMRAVRRAL